MERSRTIFAQLLDFAPRRAFLRAVSRHKGNHNVRSFSCWDQFLCMLFAQLTGRESLRDIEVCLRGMKEKLYPLGLRGKVSKSTLSDANEKRSSQIFADYGRVLIRRAQELYAGDVAVSELINFAYALDSSWISLCLSLCPWARFGAEGRAFVKLHTLLDLKGGIPAFVAISPANYNDFQSLDLLHFVPGAFYVMDKGYFDLGRLGGVDKAGAFFVIRKKKFVHVTSLSAAHIEDKSTGILADRIVKFRGKFARRKYSDHLRLIKYYAADIDKQFIFLTNNFTLAPLLICQLYKERWKVELFFRWIKQHLRVTRFYGTSLNAVETQIWIATCAYLLIAIAKKQLRLDVPLYQLLQFFSVSLFEEKPIFTALFEAPEQNLAPPKDNQLILL